MERPPSFQQPWTQRSFGVHARTTTALHGAANARGNSCSRSAAGDCGLLHALASTLGWARRGGFCDLRASRCERLPETYSARRLRQQASWIAGTAGAIPVSGPDQLTRDVLIIHTPQVPRPTCLSVTGRPDALRASLI